MSGYAHDHNHYAHAHPIIVKFRNFALLFRLCQLIQLAKMINCLQKTATENIAIAVTQENLPLEKLTELMVTFNSQDASS